MNIDAAGDLIETIYQVIHNKRREQSRLLLCIEVRSNGKPISDTIS